MKALNQFSYFDMDAFLKGKTLEVVAVTELVDHETKAHAGTKVEVVITEDKTAYDFSKGQFTNRYEHIVAKIIGKDITIPIGSKVQLVGAVGTVYGEYRNMLAVRCDSVEVVNAQIKEKDNA